MCRAVLLPLLLLAAAPACLAAQTVQGRLLEAGGGPVPGARVVLLDPDGGTAAAASTTATGAFTLTAREAGIYRLRAERIGYVATYSAPFTLEAGQTREQPPLTVNPQRVELRGIAVEARARCEVRPREGAQTAVVWEEARKALELANSAARDRVYRFDAVSFTRSLDLYTGVVLREEARPLQNFQGVPYAALSPERLAEQGFVEIRRDEMTYYAPDAGVLLSDEFLDTHCFRLKEHRNRNSGLIGLEFEPVRGRRVPDVHGVVWLDRASSELRTIEYGYTGLERRDEKGIAGGTVEFRRLPSGSWIVSRWSIRMPVIESAMNAPAWRGASAARRLAAVGVREEGGTVTAVHEARGARVAMDAGASVAGVVTDSTTGQPLAGARVYLQNTPYAGTAGEDGRFVLSGLPAGRYALAFSSPRLDSLGFRPAPVPVDLASGQTARRDLGVPPLPRVLTALCADSAAAAGHGRLAGFIRADGDAAPPGGTRVVLAWTEAGGARRELETRTDFRGIYRFCSVPEGVPMRLAVEAAGGAGAAAEGVRLAAGEPLQQDLAVARGGAGGPVLATAEEGKTHVQLRVVDGETGRPLNGALVRLGGSGGRRTGPDGTITLTNVEMGTYTVAVSHPAYGERSVQAAVADPAGVQLELRVPPRRETVALAPIVATARPLPRELAAALEERTRSGARRMVITTEMVKRVSTGSGNVENLLRAYIPGIQIRYHYYGDTRILQSITILYRGDPVTVYLDGRRADGEEIARLSPTLVQWMEFLPSGLGDSRGGIARGGYAVLHLHTVPPGQGR